MKNQIDEVIRRTQRYWYVDGLNEIVGGAIVVVLGLYYLILHAFAPTGAQAVLVGIGMPAIILASGWFSRQAVTALKARITYPRTGYASYSQHKPLSKTGLRAALLGFTAAMVFYLINLILHFDRNTIALLVAAVFSLVVAWMGYRFGLVRFYVLAVYVFLLGLVLSWLHLEDLAQNAYLFLGFGLGWIVSGGVTLIRYLHSTRPLAQEDV